jgi:hypothetical protein
VGVREPEFGLPVTVTGDIAGHDKCQRAILRRRQGDRGGGLISPVAATVISSVGGAAVERVPVDRF